MITIREACTRELDDLDLAVNEVLDQIDLTRLHRNSLGVMTCYSEFIDTGVVRALCDRLPFDVIGSTSISNGVAREIDDMMLCLTVLTSDDVEFTTLRTEALQGDLDRIASAYREKAGQREARPSMILAYFPIIVELGGEALLKRLDAACGGVPIFGTINSDHTPDNRTAQCIHNGEGYPRSAVMALLYGDANPDFHVVNIPEQKLLKQNAFITDAEGSLLKEINDMPALDFMRALGITKGDGIEGMTAIPLLVDLLDGTPPMARAMFHVTKEKYIRCGGDMPVGAALDIGNLDAADVITTARQTADHIRGVPHAQGAILFPCLSRFLALGADTGREFEAIMSALPEPLTCHISYSSGEICPMRDSSGEYRNRFHNFSIVALTF